MALYGLAGFAALALEVAWTRLVGLSIGSTTRAFAVTLTCFIVGLGLGGVAAPHLTFFRRRPVLAIALLHVAIALWSALSLPWLWGLPVRAVQIFGDPGIVGAALLGRELMLVGATILPATICMGAIFPLVAQLARARTGSAGAAVGRVLAANTIGSILGALLGGFLILPLFGMRDAIVVAAGLYLTTAALYGVAAIRLHRIGAPFAVLCKASISLAVIALMMTPSILFAFKVGAWDYSLPTAGPYIHGPALRQAIGGRTTTADRIRAVEENLGRLVDVAEASTGIVGVRELQGAKYLEVGGRNDGALFDRAQSFIAHLPMTLHDRPDRALVIGLGTAGSLQSVLRYPVRRVDCIEVSPEVVLMARAHFFKETRGAMADPRARVSIADARAHLEHTPRQYDVIVSQPSQPWNAGSAGLFTIEAFEAMRERLDGGGVACTWVGVGADPETLPTIVRTWAKVFPQSYLFDADGQGNYALLGLKAPRVFSVTRVRHSMAQAEPAEDLKHLDIIDPADMLGRLALGPSAIARFVDQGPINTDDNGIVEFNERPTGGGPKGVHEAAAAIDRLGVRPQSLIREGEMPEDLLEAFTSRFEAIERGRRIALEAMKEEAEKGRTPQFRVLLGRLQRENPRDPYLIHRLRAIGFPDGK
jgi:spermidine synthase